MGGRYLSLEVVMNDKALAQFRQRLQHRRREIVDCRVANERGVVEVREGKTDPEYEEGAQADHVEYTLEQLSEAQRLEIGQIDAALARMDAGAYGTCVECGQPIPVDRLRALPYAQRDAECAARMEKRSPPSTPTL